MNTRSGNDSSGTGGHGGKPLPVYLVLDCSGSMRSEMDTVTQSVCGLISKLTHTAGSEAPVWMSILSFSNDVRQLAPLTPLEQIQTPVLHAAGGTRLGKALGFLNRCLESELGGADRWREPQVVVMTDGRATDDWQPAADALRQHACRVFGVAVGEEADSRALGYFSTHVAQIDHRTPAKIEAVFHWLASVIDQARHDQSAGSIPPPPESLTVTRGKKQDPNEAQKLKEMIDRPGGGDGSRRIHTAEDEILQHVSELTKNLKAPVHLFRDPRPLLQNLKVTTEREFADWFQRVNERGLLSKLLRRSDSDEQQLFSALKSAVEELRRQDWFAVTRRKELDSMISMIDGLSSGQWIARGSSHYLPPGSEEFARHIERLQLAILSLIGRAESVAEQVYARDREIAAILDLLEQVPAEAAAKLKGVSQRYQNDLTAARKLRLHFIQNASTRLLHQKDGESALACLEAAESIPFTDPGEDTTIAVLKMAAREMPTRRQPVDEVDCTVFSPASVARGQAGVVQVLFHLPAQAGQARQVARQADPLAQERAFKSLNVHLRNGDAVTVEVSADGLEIEDPRQVLTWRQRTESLQFKVTAAPKTRLGNVPVKVKLFYDQIPLGVITFMLEIVRAIPFRPRPQPKPVGISSRRFNLAFASYASEDRERVLARVQMLPLVGIRFFLDVLSLEPGARWQQKLYQHIDECDLFLLFWSKFAKQSEWVRKETLHAIARKQGIDGAPPEIQPVILDSDPVEKPWDELAEIHFNDPIASRMSKSDIPPARQGTGNDDE